VRWIDSRPLCIITLGERERITLEIEQNGEHFRRTGKCQGWFGDAVDQQLLAVVKDVNGPLFDWVWKRLGSRDVPAHDCLRNGSPLIGHIRARGKGTPIEPTNLGNVGALWDGCLEANLELIGSLKDDELARELHGLAMQDAELSRMSFPGPVRELDLRKVKLHPRFAVCQGRKADGSVKVRAVDHFSWVAPSSAKWKRKRCSKDARREGSTNGCVSVCERIKHDHLDALIQAVRLFLSTTSALPGWSML